MCKPRLFPCRLHVIKMNRIAFFGGQDHPDRPRSGGSDRESREFPPVRCQGVQALLGPDRMLSLVLEFQLELSPRTIMLSPQPARHYLGYLGVGTTILGSDQDKYSIINKLDAFSVDLPVNLRLF